MLILPNTEYGSTRTLPKFDPQHRRDFHVCTNEHWALITSKKKVNKSLAIFVHGFRGHFLNTWGMLCKLLWEGADTDEALSDWDFLFLGYSTLAITSYLDIARLIATEWRKASLSEGAYDREYEKVAFFGHSLGTLGIRQLLCAAQQLQIQTHDATHGVTLFGSPLVGCPMAHLVKIAYPIASALTPNNPQIRMLKVWCEGAFAINPWPLARVVCGQGDWVAGPEIIDMVDWPGDRIKDVVNLDHFDLAKPDAWKHSVVLDYIRTALRKLESGHA